MAGLPVFACRTICPIRTARSHPIQPSLPVDPLHTSRRTTLAPFPSIPTSPPSSSLLARRHGLHPRSIATAYYAPSTTIGAHRRWIRAGEKQFQSRWGAVVGKVKEVCCPSLPPRCALAAAISPSVHSRVAAVRSAEKMREGGDKGKEQPNPAPSLFPSCMRPREVDGEGRRHGQRRRYHCTGASTSKSPSCLPIPFDFSVCSFFSWPDLLTRLGFRVVGIRSGAG